MTEDPSTNRDRDESGRFAPGNKGGPGNPQVAKVQQYRKAIWEAVSTDDVKAVIRAMVDKAIDEGDVAAAKVVLERCAGQPPKDAEDTADDVLNLAQFLRQFLAKARETVTGEPQQ